MTVLPFNNGTSARSVAAPQVMIHVACLPALYGHSDTVGPADSATAAAHPKSAHTASKYNIVSSIIARFWPCIVLCVGTILVGTCDVEPTAAQVFCTCILLHVYM